MSVTAGSDAGRQPGQRGIALVIVLWASAAIAALALAVMDETRLGRDLTRGMAASVQDRIAADSAVLFAVEMLRAQKVDSSNSLSLELGQSRITVEILPESSLVDLNAASEEVIEQLMITVTDDDSELAISLAHAVLDWRDENDLRHAKGAEAGDYRGLGLADRPANAPFRSLTELRDVFGMTDEIYERLQDQVTIHSGMEQPFADVMGVPEDDSEDDQAEEPDQAAAPDAFAADPNNLYRLDIAVEGAAGSRHRSVVVVRTESETGMDVVAFQRRLAPVEKEP